MKSILKKVFAIVGIYLISNMSLVGQNSSAEFVMPDVVPLSPEAKGIGKFGDIPVSNYTGSPDISIPIYTVKTGKLTLPITLNYHATGIEVSQEASWVGLGWNLIAGGRISYIPVGGNDQETGGIGPSDFQSLVNYLGTSSFPIVKHEDKLVGWSCIFAEDVSQIITPGMATSMLAGREQQDIYSANFANYSFKFMKHPINNTYVFLGQKNKCQIAGGIGTSGFIITGEDGITYRFENIEYSNAFPSSWLLTKIISPTGESITLTYKNATITNLPTLSESYSINEATYSTPNRILSPSTTHVLYLETIETSNEIIKFESDNSRIDLTGALKLNKIVIKDKVNLSEKFSFNFDYNYFTGSSVGGDCLDDNQSGSGSDRIGKRLKLNGVIQSSDGINNDQYAFTYYETVALPRKTSFAIDHWGFFNGQENSSTIIPGGEHTIIPNAMPLVAADGQYVSINPSFFSIAGAVRGASENASIASAGMLKSIQYPTKGKTEFAYEPHDFSNYNYMSAEDEVYNKAYITSYNASVKTWGTTPYPVSNITTQSFTLSSASYINFSGYIDYSGGAVTLQGPNTNIVRSYSSQSTNEWDDNIWLNSGTYTLTCTTPPSYVQSSDMKPEVLAQVKYGTHYSNLVNINNVGGGVRIKSVVNYDENDAVVSTKKYSYVDESGISSGKLLIPLRNFDIRDVKVGWLAGDTPWNRFDKYSTLYGNNYASLSGYLTGNNVGYDRVVVEENSGQGVTNGKEVFYFDNEAGSLYFGKIPFFTCTGNGNLLKKVTIKANGDTLLLEKNNYGLVAGSYSSETLNVYMESLYEGPTDACVGSTFPFNPLAYVGRYYIYAYPNENYHNVLMSKETSHYSPEGKLTEFVDYTYNSENYCIKSRSVSTSTNQQRTTEFKYPFNYTGQPYVAMNTTKNILNSVIEQVEKVNSTTIQTVKTNYKDWFGDQKIIAPETVVATIGASSPETRLRYKYDPYGNIIEASKENDIKTSYIWGYNHDYPVVKVEGKAETDISQTIKNAIASHVFSCKADYSSSISDVNWLSGQLSSLLSDNTCFVTFFTYDPVFGMTSHTDPNGVTTYYEYDDFGRLKNVRNDDEYITSRNYYHYYNQTTSDEGGGATQPYFSVSPSSLIFGPSGGTQSFNIQTNIDWTVIQYPSWVTLSKTSGTGDATINVTCWSTGYQRGGAVVIESSDGSTVFLTAGVGIVQNYY
ncbi:hypothetical protein [Draconibacterium mangrovi]|uniref:hypothetical protein n=1 Tax=Draconibacterium mangrovi TaxID=2697469 RepID=UPI0013D2CA1D|nr:hypothetical protein [Draconibacterium mangrovi]